MDGPVIRDLNEKNRVIPTHKNRFQRNKHHHIQYCIRNGGSESERDQVQKKNIQEIMYQNINFCSHEKSKEALEKMKIFIQIWIQTFCRVGSGSGKKQKVAPATTWAFKTEEQSLGPSQQKRKYVL